MIKPSFTDSERLALAGFLAGYRPRPRQGSVSPSRPARCGTAFITAALDAGVPLRDVQEAASHADPRTTIRYDRARGGLDRHPACIVAAYVAGAAR